MGQSLENVINKLQKIYQIRASELETIQQEMELKKVAFIIAHLKSVEEVSSYDSEKLEFFLLNVDKSVNIDEIKLACTVISMSENPVIKTGKRFLDAARILEGVQDRARKYVDDKKDLALLQAECEKDLSEMENLFNILTNKIIVMDEDFERVIDLLDTKIYPEDRHSVLVVVAALVIRNVTLMENPNALNNSVIEDVTIPESRLTPEQEAKCQEYIDFVDEKNEIYLEKKSEMVTNTYLKNIESLVERKKISLDEAKDMLNTSSNMFEYFLWNWIGKLTAKINRLTDKSEINETFTLLAALKERYDDVIERQKISEMIKGEIPVSRKIIYNVSPSGDDNSFHYNEVTLETIKLINQLKDGNSLKPGPNITNLDNGLAIITGETEFILFRKMPLNHEFILLTGKISEMDKKLEPDFLGKLSNPATFNALNNVIKNNELEYRKLMKLTEKVEEYFETVR
jgi:hypothetical protein